MLICVVNAKCKHFQFQFSCCQGKELSRSFCGGRKICRRFARSNFLLYGLNESKRTQPRGRVIKTRQEVYHEVEEEQEEEERKRKRQLFVARWHKYREILSPEREQKAKYKREDNSKCRPGLNPCLCSIGEFGLRWDRMPNRPYDHRMNAIRCRPSVLLVVFFWLQ
jgi:hypothetical protein